MTKFLPLFHALLLPGSIPPQWHCCPKNQAQLCLGTSAHHPPYLMIQVQAEPAPHTVHWIQEALTWKRQWPSFNVICLLEWKYMEWPMIAQAWNCQYYSINFLFFKIFLLKYILPDLTKCVYKQKQVSIVIIKVAFCQFCQFIFCQLFWVLWSYPTPWKVISWKGIFVFGGMTLLHETN